MSRTATASRSPTTIAEDRAGTRPARRAARLLLAAAVFAALTAAGVWLTIRFSQTELAVGESGVVTMAAGVDASGKIRNVSTDPSESYDYKASNGRFEAQFSTKAAKDASVRLSTDRGAALSFGLAGARNMPRKVKGNIIQFSPTADIRVTYTVQDDRVKETILLLAPPKTNVLTFNLSTTGLRMVKSPDGYHFYERSGQEVFWLLPPTVESGGVVKAPARFIMSKSKMQLVIDKGFLDKAFYPISIDPTVIGTSTDVAATAYATNRKLLVTSDGYLVLFYQRGADIVYRASSDQGTTWGAENVVSTSNSTQFGAVIDSDDHIYLAYLDDSAADAIRFRKLTYAGSGSYSAGNQWSAETSGTGRAYPDIFRSDAGRLWVVYRYFDGTNYALQTRYSDDNLPGWTEDGSVWSEPTVLAGPSTASRIYPTFVFYKGQPSVAYLYPTGASDAEIVWRYFNGSTWSTEDTVPGVTVASATYPMLSAVSSYLSDIHVLYTAADGIKHVRHSNATGNWSAAAAVSTNPGDAYPTVTTSGGGLTAFWSSFVGSNQHRLLYKSFNGTSWDASPTLLTPETERAFDQTWTYLSSTPWDDTVTDRDALFRFTTGPTYYGNEIGQVSSDGYPLDATAKKASIKFVMDATERISAFRLYMNRVGTAPTYRVGLQTDATGYPSGTWMNGGNAYVDVTNPGDAWTEFNIPDTDVTASATYHIAMEYVSGTVGNNNYATFAYTTPNMVPGEDVTAYDGSTWSALGATPAYVVKRSDNTYEGQSIRTDSLHALNSSDMRVGERFTPSSSLSPSAIEMRIARTGTPGEDLLLKIVDNADAPLLSATLATPASPTSPTWLSASITGLTLNAGQTYRVYATSSGVNTSNYYQVQMGVAATGTPYPELSWDTTTSFATTAGPGTEYADKTSAASSSFANDVPLFVSDNDVVYVGMADKFDYMYFDLGVAASASVTPTWQYWNGSTWASLELTENAGYDFTTDGNVGFDPPANWAKTTVNNEATGKYYVRVTRTADTLATPPVATQITAVRNNAYPTTPVSHTVVVPFAWTEGVSSPFRVKFDKLTAAAPEVSGAEARHIGRQSHETTITWQTNIPATSQIVYDTTSHVNAPYSAYAFTTTLDTSLTQSHAVKISSLASDTVYYYRILTMSADGDLTVSDEHIIPPGDLAVGTDTCAACHRSHVAWRSETWIDSLGETRSALLIRQP